MAALKSDQRHIEPRRFLQVLSAVAAGALLLMLAVNYFTDRYYVFHPRGDAFLEVLEPNTRVLKAARLEEHCPEFNAMILGSSRAAVYRSGDIDRVFGVRSFNFGVATGSLPDMLDRLTWLGRKACFPRRIFLPLSIDRLRFTDRPNDLLRKEYPAIVGTAAYRREFLLSYLGTDAFFSNLRALWEKRLKRPEPRFRYDLSAGNVDYLWDRELHFPDCPAEDVRTDAVTIARFADYLFRIRALALEQGAELTLFWNPIPLADQLAHLADARSLFETIGSLSDEIYRVPLDDPRLTDGAAFHDKGHFKPGLAAAVFETPANRVSGDRLLEELEAARSGCR